MKTSKFFLTTLFAAAAMSVPAPAALTNLGITMSDFLSGGELGTGVELSTRYTEDSTVYDFSGSGAVLEINNSTLQEKIASKTGYLTIAAWVNPAETSGIQSIFGYGGAYKGFSFDLDGGEVQFGYRKASGDKGVTEAGGPVVAGDWNLLGITVNLANVEASGNIRFLIGETSKSYYSKTPGVWGDPASKLFAVGSESCDGLYNVFTGSIANLTFFTSDGLVDNPELAAAMGASPVRIAGQILTWTGANGNSWDTLSENWKNAEGEAQAFSDYDSVVFDTEGAAITLAKNVSVDAMTVDATMTLSGDDVTVKLVSGGLKIAENSTLTIDKGVTVDFGTNPDGNSGIVVDQSGLQGAGTVKVLNTLGHGSSVKLSDAFNGTLDFTGNFNWDPAFYSLGKDATIRLTSHSDSTLWSGNVAGNIAQKLVFASDYKIALDKQSLTLSGEVDASGKKLTVQGANSLTIANNATIGSVSHNGGTINFASGKTTLGSYTGSDIQQSTVINVAAETEIEVSGNFILRNQHAGETLSSTLNLEGKMKVDGSFAVARDGYGYANVKNGAVLEVGALVFGANETWTGETKGGIVNLTSGGTLVAGAISSNVTVGGTKYKELNNSVFNLEGGTLGTNADALTLNIEGLPVKLKANTTTTINTSKYVDGAFSEKGAAITIANAIDGKNGALKVDGVGTLTLSGDNTYTGGTTLVGGTLVAGKASSLGSGTVAVSGGNLTANAGLTVEKVTLQGGSMTAAGNVSVNEILVVGGSADLATLTTGTVSVSGGSLNVKALTAPDAKLNLKISGGELSLENGTSAEYSVVLDGGKLSGLNLASAKDSSSVELRAGTLGVADLSKGTLKIYSDFVEEGRLGDYYLNNTVELTIDGSLTLSTDTQIDISNLVFEKSGESYALFSVGEGVDGGNIAGEFNEAGAGELAGSFSYDALNNYIVFTAGAGMETALTWDCVAPVNYWTATEFQGTKIENFEKRMVRFGRVLPLGTHVEEVIVTTGAHARTLEVSAADGDTYNLRSEAGVSLSLDNLKVSRGSLNVLTQIKTETLEISGGTLIAGQADALNVSGVNGVRLDGGMLSLNEADSLTASKIVLNGGSALAFVEHGLDKLSGKVEIDSTSASAPAVLSWLSSDDAKTAKTYITNKVAIGANAHVEFNIGDELTGNWVGAGAEAIAGSNTYYKTGAGTFFLQGAEALSGTFNVTEGTLALGHADETGRIFNGNIIVSGENASLLLGEVNSFGTGDFDPVSVELSDGAEMLLAYVENGDRQMLKNVSLVLGDDAVVRSAKGETPNQSGLWLGAGTTIKATGNSEIATTIQLANTTDGTEFNVEDGASLKLSGSVINSQEGEEGDLVKTGAGTLVLATSPSTVGVDYQGETVVQEGTLRFEGNAVAGSGNVTLNAGATLEVDAKEGNTISFFGGVVAGGDGSGKINVLSGKSVFYDIGKTGDAFEVYVAEDAEMSVYNDIYGSVNLDGTLGGGGRVHGDVVFGEDAKLRSLTIEAGAVSGTRSFTKIDVGTLRLKGISELDHVTLAEGTLVSENAVAVNTLTLAGGRLSMAWTGTSATWSVSKLEVAASENDSQIWANAELVGAAGLNNLSLGGTLRIDEAELKAYGTLNLSRTERGKLIILSNAKLSADVLNADASVSSIELAAETLEDEVARGVLSVNDAVFAGNLTIKERREGDGDVERDVLFNDVVGAVEIAGTARFEGTGKSVIEGLLLTDADGAIVDVVSSEATLEIGKLRGALTKNGEGQVKVRLVKPEEVTELHVEGGQLLLEEIHDYKAAYVEAYNALADDQKPENPGDEFAALPTSALTKVSLTDEAKFSVRKGVLEIADGGTFEISDGASYNGNLVIGEGATLIARDAKIINAYSDAGALEHFSYSLDGEILHSGVLEIVGDAYVDNLVVDGTLRLGHYEERVNAQNVRLEWAYESSEMKGKLYVSGTSTAIKATAFEIYSDNNFTFDNIVVEGGLESLGSEYTLIEWDAYSLGDFFLSAPYDSAEVDGREFDLVVENEYADGGAVKIIAYGTLLWNGAEEWKVGTTSGWERTTRNGNYGSGFVADRYVEFGFDTDSAISVKDNVNVGGVIFKGTGEFTLNFSGDGLIKDKEGGTASKLTVSSGTVIFNDQGVTSTEGVFSGGLTVAAGAVVKTNSDKLIGSGAITLGGTLAFEGKKNYTLDGALVTSGVNAVLDVASGASLTLKELSGTVLTKDGAGSLTLADSAELERFVVKTGSATVNVAGETKIKSFVVEAGAETLAFGDDASFADTTTLSVAGGKQVTFGKNGSKLNFVSLANGASVSTDGAFTLGGTVFAEIDAVGSSEIDGNLALLGAVKDGESFTTGATFNVADAGTLTVGSVSDAETFTGDFLIEKSGKGTLKVAGDVDSKASLLIADGAVAVDGEMNLAGDIEVARTASLSAAGGTLGAEGKSLALADGATLSLISTSTTDELSVASNLTAAGTVLVKGEVEFAGTTNLYSLIEVSAGSELEIASTVTSFQGNELKLGKNATLEVAAKLSNSSGVLTVDESGTVLDFENDSQITFDSVVATGKRTLGVSGAGTLRVTGEVEADLTLDIEKDATVEINNEKLSKKASVGKLSGEGTFKKTGAGDLYIVQKSAASFTGTFVAEEGTTHFSGSGSLGQANLVADSEIVFDRTAVVGAIQDDTVAKSLVGGSGTVAVSGTGNSLTFTNKIAEAFEGTLEARNGGTLVYNESSAAESRNLSLKNGGTLSVAGETTALGTLSVSGKANEVVLAEKSSLNVGRVNIKDSKGVGALVFSGDGNARIERVEKTANDSKAELDIYTDEGFSGTVTFGGSESGYRDVYVYSGTVAFEGSSESGAGNIVLMNKDNAYARFDVGAGNELLRPVLGTGTVEGVSGEISKLEEFSGKIIAVNKTDADGNFVKGEFTVNKGASAELASKSELVLSAEKEATLTVTTDETVADLDMGYAVFSGEGTVKLDLVDSQTLSVYNENAITGTLEIVGGKVKVLKDGNLGTAEIVLGKGAVLDFASSVLFNDISGAGTFVKNTNGTSFIDGTINANVEVTSGALAVTGFGGGHAEFLVPVTVKNGTLEFSQAYNTEAGKVVSRSDGDEKTFKAAYVVDGVARFSHAARNSSSIVEGTLDWVNDASGSLVFVGGGAGSLFNIEIASGDIVKAGTGKWTLAKFSSDGAVKIENGGGTLEVLNYVGKDNQEIYIGKDGVFEIAGFDGSAESVVRGVVSGTGILAVSDDSGEVSFDLTGESDWTLAVKANTRAVYGADLSADKILLAASENYEDLGGTMVFDVVDGKQALALDGKTLTIQGLSKDAGDFRNAMLVKKGAGTLDLTKATVNLDGLLQITEGTVKAVSFKSAPSTGVIEIQGNALLEVGAKGSTGTLAALEGSGTVNFVAGTTLVENVNGAVASSDFNKDFVGTARIGEGATVRVSAYASFGNGNVEILGTLQSSQEATSTLKNLSGNGLLKINNNKSAVSTVYDSGNTFTGTIEVQKGRLVVDTDKFAGLTNTVALSSDANSGLVIRNDNGDSVALSGLAGKKVSETGTVFLESANEDSGFVLGNGESFGYASRTHLLAGASLAFGEGATLNSGLAVADGASLRFGSAKSRAVTSVVGARTVNGDFTLAGELLTEVPDAGTSALYATGTAAIKKTALVEVGGAITEGEEFVLISSAASASIESGALFRAVSGERLNVYVTGDDLLTKVVVGMPTSLSVSVPDGLETLNETILADTYSDIYQSIYWQESGAAEQRAKLTNYSPVSFAGALELSTGLTQIENDLLRQRLEQRRYDRAYPETEGEIKAYANVIGSTSNSSEGENKSANYDMSHSGAVVGFDTLVNYDFVLGASFTYDFGKAKVHNNGGKHETDTARVNVYGMSMIDEVSYFGFGVGLGVIGLDTKRTNALETLKGDASGTDLSFSTTLGRMFVLDEENGLHVSPYIGLDYTYSRIGGFKEIGGTQSALDVDDLERNSLRGIVGATLNWLPTADWRLTLEAAYRHEFLDTDTDIDAKFVGGAYAGMSASSTAYFGGNDVISVGPRVEYRINSEWSVSAGYTLESDFDNTTTHSANVGVRCKF